MDRFNGRSYRSYSSENYDEYLKACGVGWFSRKLALSMSSVIELSKNKQKYIFTSLSTLKCMMHVFVTGVEFDDFTAADKKAKTAYFVDERRNVLLQIQVDQHGIVYRTEWTWSEDFVYMVSNIGTTKCTRVFKLIL